MEDNIKIDLQEVGWAWTGLIWLKIGDKWRAL
jgi:hypothetical protein